MSYQFDEQIAKCTVQDLSWMTNSLGQSPCQVGSVLAFNACGYTQFHLGQFEPPDFTRYADVEAYMATPCQCNSVTFNLVSACALCQGGENADWLSYSRNCWGEPNNVPQTKRGEYPGTLPVGIAVPAWAYWNPVGKVNFQFATEIARDFAGPDSTRSSPAGPTSTSTSAIANPEASTTATTTSSTTSSSSSGTSSGTGTTGTTTSSTTSTRAGGGGQGGSATDPAILSDAPQPSNTGGSTDAGNTGSSDNVEDGSSNSRSSNTGAIAGGAVGGAVALILLAALIFWLLRRRRARAKKEVHPEMSAVDDPATGGGGFAPSHQAPGYSYEVDDSELPPDYATVYGEETTAEGDDPTDAPAEIPSAQPPSTSRPAGSGSSKFPDPHAPIPSRRIPSVHKSPLP